LAIFKTTDIHKQRINIKFCVKLCKPFPETHKMMQNAYGDHQCYDWFKRSKDGRELVDDVDPRSERLPTLTDGARVTRVDEIVRFNRRSTI